MILVDTELKKREEQDNPIKVGLVGAGDMARGIARLMVQSVPGMELVVISNRTLDNAKSAYADAGIDDVIEVTCLNEFEDAIAVGKRAITQDALMLCESETLDVLVDATGAVEFGAQLAEKAAECKMDVVSMNVELDATVGSVIQQRARKAGTIYSIADGDQPGVQLNLWRFVKGIGVEPLVCGNIKGLQDFYRNPTTQKSFAEQWGQSVNMVTSFADGSKISMEQACTANATGMQVEMRGMRGGDHVGHVDELCHIDRYDIDKLRELGGVVDYVVKAQPGPGVFVLGTMEEKFHRHHFDLYKLGKGPLYSFYRPYHLCYFEVPSSVARAVFFRDSVVAADRPMVDVISMAKKDLKAGEMLDIIGGYTVYGQCENYPVARAERLLPQGLAEGCVLKRDIPKDTAISYDDVDVPEGRLCDKLRTEQDELFPV
ncbi:MAG: NAD(P)-dependent oxidoreductase [Kiritimatiellales bacterium]|nr:NAD(P)-dependent oxidoreductase [Kiritimatiellales bacterium]